MTDREPGNRDVRVLLARIRAADTPHQAWAARALVHSGDSRHRPIGRAMLDELRAGIPQRAQDFEHGDVACFSILADDALTLRERRLVAEAVPPLNDTPARRARFYASPLYVYLTARGLGTDLANAAGVAAFIAKDAIETAGRPATDLSSLILRFATAVEMSAVSGVNDALLRATHARIINSAGEPEGAIAIRWLLELYSGRWPSGADAAALRASAERYAGDYDPTAVNASDLRPEVATMRLETLTTADRSYRLVRDEDLFREVKKGVGRRRIFAAIAYAVVIAVAFAVPAWMLIKKAPSALTLVAGVAFMTWAPTALWAALWEFGRLRRDRALAAAIVLCLSYYAYVAYVTLTGAKLEIDGKEAAIAIVPVLLATMFGAAPAVATTSQAREAQERQ